MATAHFDSSFQVTPRKKICGRLAPSPTGRLHMGNAWAFLCAWLGARKTGGELVLRIEDIDPQRSRDEYAEALQQDLLWLGLDWDYGPGSSEALGPYRQSDRLESYLEGLRLLEDQGLVYPCFCTRKELREMAGAPQAGVMAESVYSGRCLNLPPEQVQANIESGKSCSLRLKFDAAARQRYLELDDLCLGHKYLSLEDVGGDFPIRRSDGTFAYQLAVVLDDIAMGVTQVVRGMDILSSTPRQLYLYDCFGAPPPEYAHVPLLLEHQGERLAKRHESLALPVMRERGVKPEEIIGWLAFWSGLASRPTCQSASELLSGFDFQHIRADVDRLPENLGSIFPALS